MWKLCLETLWQTRLGCRAVSETLARQGNGVTFDQLGIIMALATLSPEHMPYWDDVHMGLEQNQLLLSRKKGEVGG